VLGLTHTPHLNRVTVNLFKAGTQSLSVISEKLGNEGCRFSRRSDSIKIALRLATNTTVMN